MLSQKKGVRLRSFIVLAFAFALIAPTAAQAHQPVVLLDTDTTAARGPLLVDGTISFAVRAAFSKAGQKKAFRAGFKEGEQLSMQYLIIDQKPENALRTNQMPLLQVIAPSGKKFMLKLDERTKFFEPFGKTNYFYLGRYSAPAEAGTYSFLLTSRGRAAITLAVGELEILGEVTRGAAPTATAKPTATPTKSAEPTPTPTKSAAGYTLKQVAENSSAASCWSAIDGFVYDLTRWIALHPGGEARILSLCGIDGTTRFKAQHAGQNNPTSRLSTFLLGPLIK